MTFSKSLSFLMYYCQGRAAAKVRSKILKLACIRTTNLTLGLQLILLKLPALAALWTKVSNESETECKSSFKTDKELLLSQCNYHSWENCTACALACIWNTEPCFCIAPAGWWHFSRANRKGKIIFIHPRAKWLQSLSARVPKNTKCPLNLNTGGLGKDRRGGN